jgi:hypothetical protein
MEVSLSHSLSRVRAKTYGSRLTKGFVTRVLVPVHSRRADPSFRMQWCACRIAWVATGTEGWKAETAGKPLKTDKLF